MIATGYAAILSVALGYRVVRCPVCDGADCLGAVGRLCNSRRVEVGRALPEEPPATLPPPPARGDQLLLFGGVTP